MRIMFVGDSITIGSAGDHTWRYRLWRGLSRRTAVEVVGPRTALYDPATDAATSHAYADPAFPQQHLAGWGEGWLHMAPLIGPAVAAHRPDVLLVALGLIDLGFYTNAAQTTQNVHAFVTAARESNPRIRMAILPVLRNVVAANDPSFDAECAHFNDLLTKTLAELSTPTSPLTLVEPPTPWPYESATHDGTHLSPAGERVLADVFWRALEGDWGTSAPCR
ncbi:GDSL-type esterase/lipase family protein [Streptomyces polyrhachis]|uniref:GDSL-type esterase/lipase family protein n=1 Tax=Streptomyces polyrhachis TaxID=1282885 RepID=A0ABW2GF02_9ACTN